MGFYGGEALLPSFVERAGSEIVYLECRQSIVCERIFFQAAASPVHCFIRQISRPRKRLPRSALDLWARTFRVIPNQLPFAGL